MTTRTKLAVVEGGECHPYRRVELEETESSLERRVCTDCRHHKETNPHTDNIEWRYRCLRAPQYEEHVNYVNGEAMFFDRRGWDELLRGREMWGADWRPNMTEKDFFMTSQRYQSCWERNADGLCPDHERAAALVLADQREETARMWAEIRPCLAGLIVGAVAATLGMLLAILTT